MIKTKNKQLNDNSSSISSATNNQLNDQSLITTNKTILKPAPKIALNKLYLSPDFADNKTDIMKNVFQSIVSINICSSNKKLIIRGLFTHNFINKLYTLEITLMIAKIIKQKISDIYLYDLHNKIWLNNEKQINISSNMKLKQLILFQSKNLKQCCDIIKNNFFIYFPKEIANIIPKNMKLIKLMETDGTPSDKIYQKCLYQGLFAKSELKTLKISDIQKFTKTLNNFAFFYNNHLLKQNQLVYKKNVKDVFGAKAKKIGIMNLKQYTLIKNHQMSLELYDHIITNTINECYKFDFDFDCYWLSEMTQIIHCYLFNDKWPINIKFNNKNFSIYPYTKIIEFLQKAGIQTHRREYRPKSKAGWQSYTKTVFNNKQNICYNSNDYMYDVGLFHSNIGDEFDMNDLNNSTNSKYRLSEQRAYYNSGNQQFIKTLTGKTITIDTPDLSIKVIMLKYKIFQKEGIEIEKQRLIYAGKQLEDDKTLAYYSLYRDRTIHLVYRLRSG